MWVCTHHGCHFQILCIAHDFNHQVGADIARTNDGTLNFFHNPYPSGYALKYTQTEPKPSISALNSSPTCTATMGPNAPVNTTSPPFKGRPRRTISSASQSAALSGLSTQALPCPSETTSSARVICIRQFTRSTS